MSTKLLLCNGGVTCAGAVCESEHGLPTMLGYVGT